MAQVALRDTGDTRQGRRNLTVAVGMIRKCRKVRGSHLWGPQNPAEPSRTRAPRAAQMGHEDFCQPRSVRKTTVYYP